MITKTKQYKFAIDSNTIRFDFEVNSPLMIITLKHIDEDLFKTNQFTIIFKNYDINQ